MAGLACLAAACAGPAPRPESRAPQPVARRAATSAESFEAVLRIEAKSRYKRFQGVWLERDGGEKWVIAYRAEACWRPFDNRRVHVEGERYEPEGQAILAPHLRVRLLRVVDPKAEPMPELVEVREERELEGTFEVERWPEGTKLAGESQNVFVAGDGKRYLLAAEPDPMPEPGRHVRVRAREVVPSPYFTHVGGDTLFVLEVLER